MENKKNREIKNTGFEYYRLKKTLTEKIFLAAVALIVLLLILKAIF